MQIARQYVITMKEESVSLQGEERPQCLIKEIEAKNVWDQNIRVVFSVIIFGQHKLTHLLEVSRPKNSRWPNRIQRVH